MIALAHALFALVTAIMFRFNPIIAVIFSLVPDMEYVLPTFHRGPLHSLIVIIPIFLVVYFYDKDAGFSALTGMLSHIFLDSLTEMGVPIFYPITSNYYSLHFIETNQITFLTIILSVIFILNIKKLKGIDTKYFVPILIFFAIVPVIGNSTEIFADCSDETIFISEVQNYEGEYVTVEGIICSEVKDYTSTAGNEYQDFQLCNGTEVRIFKIKSVQENLLKRGDSVRICGKYTSDHGGELYMIDRVEKS